MLKVGGSEFEGLRGGFRMMSLLTLFGGLKNVFKVKKLTTDTVIFRLHYKVTLGCWACSHLQLANTRSVKDMCRVKRWSVQRDEYSALA